MRLVGTLKCEILKPLPTEQRPNDDWDHVGSRMRALRESLAPALTLTMREVYPGAVDAIKLFKEGPESREAARAASYQWESRVEKLLRQHWNQELKRRLDYQLKLLAGSCEREEKKLTTRLRALKKSSRGYEEKKTRLMRQLHECGERRSKRAQVLKEAHGPVQEYLSAETRQNILARFTGKPLKDLMASRVSVPSWVVGCAFYARNRECPISGKAEEARLEFPLYGGGSKRTLLAVIPCGEGHAALWDRLVEGKIKLGRVGITFEQRKQKNYALLSWTEERDISLAGAHVAAVNLGVNVFLQAVSDEGETFQVDGGDILATRRRFYHRRKSIQKALDTMGKGSRGHGRKRRLRPLTDVSDSESRWVTTKCRMVAAELIKWCKRHHIGRLIFEDLTEVRKKDEKEDTHASVKRLLHSWPYAELIGAVTREGDENGVAVETKEAYYDSQKCPRCRHTSQDNVQPQASHVVYLNPDHLIEPGDRSVTWERRVSEGSKFECRECHYKSAGDLVAAQNLLASVIGDEAAFRAGLKARGQAVKRIMPKVERVLSGKKTGSNGVSKTKTTKLNGGRHAHP